MVHIIWQKIATVCKIVCNGCWIISDIAAVPKRMMHAYRQKDSWLSEMQVFDFTSMYDKFVHHDMKLRLRELTTMVFDYMSGKPILPSLHEYCGRRGFQRDSGQHLTTMEVHYSSDDSRGVTAVDSTNWSERDVHDKVRNGVRLDADTLNDMVDFIIDNSYVSHAGITYRQTAGMVKGVNNAPQMANLYCAYYELEYMTRRAVHYLHTLKQHEVNPTIPRSPVLRAEMTALFNFCRLMDDIAAVGMPHGIDTAAVLRDERSIGSTDGVYPVHILDADGVLCENPMLVNPIFKSPESEGNCESIRDVSTFETHHPGFKKWIGAIIAVALGAAI